MVVNKYISEIYTDLQNTNSKNEKKAILANNRNNQNFITTLINTFHPNVKFYWDETTFPAYKPLVRPIDMGIISYEEALRRSYLFIVGDPRASANITAKQRENLLIQIMESLGVEEGEVYKKMILKQQPAKGVTANLVREVFPNLLPMEE